MDEVEYIARSWAVSERLLAICSRYEERFGLAPDLLDRLDSKAALFVRDPHDEDAKEALDIALLAFLEAAVEAMD